jgi:hypothetical protein
MSIALFISTSITTRTLNASTRGRGQHRFDRPPFECPALRGNRAWLGSVWLDESGWLGRCYGTRLCVWIYGSRNYSISISAISFASISVPAISIATPTVATISAVTFAAHGPVVLGHAIEVFVLFEKIGDVQERIALQAQVDEGRLHAWQHARHASLVNTTRERILVGPLEVNLHQLIVFDQRHLGLMPVGGNDQFFAHASLPPPGEPEGEWTGARRTLMRD